MLSVRFFHYLEGFLTMGPANSFLPIARAHCVCFIHLRLRSARVFRRFCFSRNLTELTQQLACLPPDKVDLILRPLQSWARKKNRTRRELESLIGFLLYAYRVVVPGQTFLRRMIDLFCCFRHRKHLIRLNVEFRGDQQSVVVVLPGLKWGISFSIPHSVIFARLGYFRRCLRLSGFYLPVAHTEILRPLFFTAPLPVHCFFGISFLDARNLP